MTCGIYAIVHTATSLRYVGQSVNIEDRWAYHRRDLNGAEDHSSMRLQELWTRDGASAFAFKVLERCEAAVLHHREQHHMDEAQALGKLLNTNPIASRNPALTERQKLEGEIAKEQAKMDLINSTIEDVLEFKRSGIRYKSQLREYGSPYALAIAAKAYMDKRRAWEALSDEEKAARTEAERAQEAAQARSADEERARLKSIATETDRVQTIITREKARWQNYFELHPEPWKAGDYAAAGVVSVLGGICTGGILPAAMLLRRAGKSRRDHEARENLRKLDTTEEQMHQRFSNCNQSIRESLLLWRSTIKSQYVSEPADETFKKLAGV